MSELVVDLFCGAGGTSEGVRIALGRAPDIAANHSDVAIAVHSANHPTTVHYREDVFDVSPRRVCGSRRVGLLIMSPDCRHFSRSKGEAPRDERIRSLAEVAQRWAAEVRPRVIIVENVEEFTTWGPLLESGMPDPERAGETFRQWVAALRARGYEVEWRTLVAADFGAPTSRKRLFVVARCDGQPISWPEPTHGPGRSEPWRPAADAIDWSRLPGSIFDRARPHAEATLRRIADGVRRYVIESPRPYLVGDAAWCLVHRGNGERVGQRPRSMDIARPLGTVVAGGVKHGLVAAFISKHYGGVVGHGLERPLGTITTKDHHALTTATLAGARDRHEEVRRFLERYAPATSLFREPFVMVDGERRPIIDIGMRMLMPAELARASSFPAGYDLDLGGTVPVTKQTAHVGNAVPPLLAAAIVRANVTLEGRAAA